MGKTVCAVVVVFVALCASGWAANDWSQSFEVRGTPDVRLTSNDAHIRVSTGDQARISARLLVKGFVASDYEVRPRQSGDRVEIEVHLLPRPARFDWGDKSLELEVTMPARGNLEARTDDGHVTVGGLAGQVRVHTGDGHINARDLNGVLDLETGDGHINIVRSQGTLRAHTTDGHMSVEGRFEALDLDTGDGHVSARVEEGSMVSRDWNLRTGDGRIELELPRGFSAELDASTGDGHVRVDLAGATQVQAEKEEHNYRARLGSGGKLLRVRTGDGSISIRQR